MTVCFRCWSDRRRLACIFDHVAAANAAAVKAAQQAAADAGQPAADGVAGPAGSADEELFADAMDTLEGSVNTSATEDRASAEDFVTPS